MRPETLLLIVAVSACNIALHLLLVWTAATAGSYREALLSSRFAVAFAVGTLTALLMLAVYVHRVELARALVLMGALSVLGGVLVGVLVLRGRLDPVEWTLFGLMAALYAWRAWRLLATPAA